MQNERKATPKSDATPLKIWHNIFAGGFSVTPDACQIFFLVEPKNKASLDPNGHIAVGSYYTGHLTVGSNLTGHWPVGSY